MQLTTSLNKHTGSASAEQSSCDQQVKKWRVVNFRSDGSIVDECHAMLKENIKTQGKVVDSFLLIFHPFYILLLSQRIKYMKQMVQNVTVVLLKVSHFDQIYSTFLRG